MGGLVGYVFCLSNKYQLNYGMIIKNCVFSAYAQPWQGAWPSVEPCHILRHIGWIFQLYKSQWVMSLRYAQQRQWALTLVAGSIAKQGLVTCLLPALMPSTDDIKTWCVWKPSVKIDKHESCKIYLELWVHEYADILCVLFRYPKLKVTNLTRNKKSKIISLLRK